MIYLTKIERDENMARFYVLDVQPTLFGDWSLLKEWGRIGREGRQRIALFGKRCDANVALTREVKRRMGRGYVVTL